MRGRRVEWVMVAVGGGGETFTMPVGGKQSVTDLRFRLKYFSRKSAEVAQCEFFYLAIKLA